METMDKDKEIEKIVRPYQNKGCCFAPPPHPCLECSATLIDLNCQNGYLFGIILQEDHPNSSNLVHMGQKL